MSENKHVKFTCRNCGSNKLAYHEYVKSITPAEFMSCGKLYYAPAVIDEDDFVPESRGFCCRDCGHMLERCGSHIRTEKELLEYLENNSDTYFQPGSADEQAMFELMYQTEKDGVRIHGFKRDI